MPTSRPRSPSTLLALLTLLAVATATAATGCGAPAPASRVASARVTAAPAAPSASPLSSPSLSSPAAPPIAEGGTVATLPAAPGGRTPVFTHAGRGPGGGRGDSRDGGQGHRRVALTFDADMTADQGARAARGERFDHPALIATLRRLKVPATVFMTGRWAEEYPDQARSIGRDPLFEVANHSYSHHAFTPSCYGLPTVPPGGMRDDVEQAFTAFRRVGVRSVPYFRFPGGCYDDRALRAVAPTGVTAVQWDVVGGDAFARDPDRVVDQVLSGVRDGSVVVLHCTRSAAPVTEEAVRRIVPALRGRGYRTVKVSELIGGPAPPS
ncbi:polysaccharide deacetylase family protein [Streptomyces sp. MST-110588]|uniref:polysaccharide deacetylase family protein n=1 Tax=Streptomyces sp. MST-110588 TaxID=2833628 RepID=UPI001F5D4B93|nr:polysaccharide deacetylase family protein [Streptomyces sp. MST-110588]UNO39439.1 polysaccharide deacetylase family protein [Streptomyces sp. MST-110588]